jgi:lipopolysaccharide transport system ATP-binding protein
MSLPVITIENLGKKYRLTHQAERQRYTTLRDVIAERAKRLFRRHPPTERKGRARTEDFWALKDVSLEIKQGEVVGIIGRNGAGKSTLLKILSRITEPTAGRVRIRGRVASLLEVGTGFHPELTGRENIYLNGAILGMARAEIRRKFDEIVAFAEVEKFLDTPVKHYSSGMYVRLAFAVAAHLEPEILVVDEVLAVGDAEFQKKCLGKMEHVSKESGRTILFVSHNMAVIQALCPKAIVLDRGAVKFIGSSVDASAINLMRNHHGTHLQRAVMPDRMLTITDLELVSAECVHRTELIFRMRVQGLGVRRCCIEAKISDQIGVPVGFASVGLLDPVNALDLRPGCEEFICRVRLPRMAHGTYRLSVQVGLPMVQTIDSTGDGICFDLHPIPLSGYERVLEAQWGYGAFELPLDIDRAVVMSTGLSIDPILDGVI